MIIFSFLFRGIKVILVKKKHHSAIGHLDVRYTNTIFTFDWALNVQNQLSLEAWS